MEDASTINNQLWEVQLRSRRAQAHIESREWLKRFALTLLLIVLALAAAAGIASLSNDAPIRL